MQCRVCCHYRLATKQSYQELNAKYEHDPRYCIRCQGRNTGASAARNHGLLESAAEWIPFLDDDVARMNASFSSMLMQLSQTQAFRDLLDKLIFPKPCLFGVKQSILLVCRGLVLSKNR